MKPVDSYSVVINDLQKRREVLIQQLADLDQLIQMLQSYAAALGINVDEWVDIVGEAIGGMSLPTTMIEATVQALIEVDRPLTTAEIHGLLQAQGARVKKSSLAAILSREVLAPVPRIVRVTRGLWALAKQEERNDGVPVFE